MATYDFLPKAYLQGEFIDFADAKVSVATHALQYGTGASGGMRAISNPENPKEVLLFRLEDHCQRLSNSAKMLLHDLPAAEIKRVIIEFIKLNKPTGSIYLRPLVYNSDLGLSPRLHECEKDFLLYGVEMGEYMSGDGIACCFSSWMRQMDAALPLRGKVTGAYITSALAKSEAIDRGFDEAIMMNSQGKVCEGSAMNLFFVRKGKLYTPGVDQDILEGITRDSVITIARDMGLEVIERPVDKTELLIADEVFLSGTAAKVAPVTRIEGYALPSDHTIANGIRKVLVGVTEGREQRYAGWVSRVSIA